MSEKTMEQQAGELGWQPKERFRGDPEKWVDAEEYVKRGETVLPLVKATNSRLSAEVGSLKSQNAAQAAAIEEMREQMSGLTALQTEMLAAKLKEQRVGIRAQIRKAREDGDDAALEDLEAALDDNAEAAREVKAKAEKKPAATPPPTPATNPAFDTWKGENVWFGGESEDDQRKTGIANGLGTVAANRGLRGKAFFDYIDGEMGKLFADDSAPAPNKAEGGRPRTQGSGKEKTYSALPADAKAQCDADAKRFVGEGKGKLFKTDKEFQAHFAALYFTE